MRWLAAWCALATGAAAAQSPVWIIGGGSGIDNAQVQIEQNTRWLQQLLLEHGLGVRTYFALGNEPGKDVSFWRDPDVDDAAGLATLARIFGEPETAGLRYRRHQLGAVAGGTRKDSLIRALESDFAAIPDGSEVLVVFNGHGGLEGRDGRSNYLKLWDDERLAVDEVDRLFDAIPGNVTTRFVMAQCYSGAFQSLIDDDGGAPAPPAGGRCGFMSQSALDQAEGCGLDPDESGYRDYTSYFFAGLMGESRAGTPVDPASVDLDGNGRISFREAHFHAVAEADSIDLARATSETYLTDWTPWYLEWDTSIDGRDSVYWSLAERVGERLGQSLAPADLEQLRGELLDRAAQVRAARTEVDGQITAAQEHLRTSLLAQWPELAHPYTAGYHALVDAHWAEVDERIRSGEAYAALLAAENERLQLRGEDRDLRRHITQIDKIYRLKQLARLDAAIRIHGSSRARDEYAALVECESGYLENNDA